MDWYHTCSENWLRARQSKLMATDVVSLIPTLKKYLKDATKLTDEITLPFIKLKLEKMAGDINTVSTGAAARGHCREAYSLKAYNEEFNKKLFHWDDAIIYDAEKNLGFSPDALDIQQDTALAIPSELIAPTEIAEIKNYSIAKHLDVLYADATKIKERFQLAVAFVVCPSLEIGHLIFDNPNCVGFEALVYDYTRNDLEIEIEQVNLAASLYKTINQNMCMVRFDADKTKSKPIIYHRSDSDQSVYEATLKKRK